MPGTYGQSAFLLDTFPKKNTCFRNGCVGLPAERVIDRISVRETMLALLSFPYLALPLRIDVNDAFLYPIGG